MENQTELQYSNNSPSRLSQNPGDPLHNGSLHPRLAWMMAYRETGNAQAVCNRFGISRKTFYKWLKRYEQSDGDSTSLCDRSRRPHHFPRATRPEHVELLRRVREETGFGQRRLRAYMEEKYRVSLSERTIWKLLKREDEDSPALASQG
ncbi:MAG TPA: helix-turn-helix domain-containing protein [Bacteroidota bacterium]|nr:helix-turn-helix domain-containing protein [Bacteroidota bacterium]